MTADGDDIHISFHLKERQKKSIRAFDTLLRKSLNLQIKSPAMKKGFIPLAEAMETSREGLSSVFPGCAVCFSSKEKF